MIWWGKFSLPIKIIHLLVYRYTYKIPPMGVFFLGWTPKASTTSDVRVSFNDVELTVQSFQVAVGDSEDEEVTSQGNFILFPR